MRTNWTTNKVYFSDLLPDRYPLLYKELAEEIVAAGHQVDLLRGTRDIWCRDFMPIQVDEANYVQFQYKPDYLLGCEDMVTDAGMVRQILPLRGCRESSLVIDGGNVVNNTDTIIMTDKVMRENPDLTSSQVKSRVQKATGVKNVVLIPVEPDDECGHSDGVLQFLNENTLLVNDYSMTYPDYGKRVLEAISAAGFDYIEIPYVPDEDVTGDFTSALGNYVNILYMKNLVVVPIYGIAADTRVREIYTDLFKDRKVKFVDCSDLAKQGGVLNCISWNVRVPSDTL